MRIAYVNQPWNRIVPPVNAGSIAIWNYQISNRLSSTHDIDIFSKRSPGQASSFVFENVKYHFINTNLDRGLNRLFKRLSRQRGRMPSFSADWHYALYITRIANSMVASSFRPDIVHLHNFSQFVPVIRKKLPAAKIVLHMHTEWLTQLGREVISKRLDQVDMIVGCSQFVIDQVRASFPGVRARCEVVYNGVDAGVFHRGIGKRDAGKGEFRILYVGRISPEKGIHVLIRAFADVAKTYPNAILAIVGPDAVAPYEYLVGMSDDPKVQELARYYRGKIRYFEFLKSLIPSELNGRVNFIGSIPHDQIHQYFQQADLLVNPSMSESFGVSLLEAMACEVPVLATRVGGMREIVDEDKTGILVEAGDHVALAEGISKLLGDSMLRESLGTNGRKRVLERFSWERIVSSLADHYETIV